MMGTREPFKGGDEWEALCRGSRRLTYWRPGVVSRSKRKFWKRARKRARVRALAESRVTDA